LSEVDITIRAGRFEDVAAAVGLADNVETRAAAWGDFDGDGHPDLYVGFIDGTPNKLYHNDGNGRHFTDVAGAYGVNLSGVTQLVDPAASLTQVAPQPPEQPQDPEQMRQRRAVVSQVPVHRGSQIGRLSLQSPGRAGLAEAS